MLDGYEVRDTLMSSKYVRKPSSSANAQICAFHIVEQPFLGEKSVVCCMTRSLLLCFATHISLGVSFLLSFKKVYRHVLKNMDKYSQIWTFIPPF